MAAQFTQESDRGPALQVEVKVLSQHSRDTCPKVVQDTRGKLDVRQQVHLKTNFQLLQNEDSIFAAAEGVELTLTE